jgi:hypothetical protein
MERLPEKCPKCGDKLVITQLECVECGTNISGIFSTNVFSKLNRDEYEFILTFLGARGSIKTVEKKLGISYPTVRSKLDDILHKLNLITKQGNAKDRMKILEKVESGELTVEEAIKLLKK